MLGWLKRKVFLFTWKHAESRYSIFVWVRQVNDRMMRLEEWFMKQIDERFKRLENEEVEQAVQERTENEAYIEAQFQKINGIIGQVHAGVDKAIALQNENIEKLSQKIREMEDQYKKESE